MGLTELREPGLEVVLPDGGVLSAECHSVDRHSILWPVLRFVDAAQMQSVLRVWLQLPCREQVSLGLFLLPLPVVDPTQGVPVAAESHRLLVGLVLIPLQSDLGGLL